MLTPVGVTGNRIIDLECLSAALYAAHDHLCPHGKLKLSDDPMSRRGLQSKLTLECSICGEKTTFNTSKRRTSVGQSSEVNRRSVLATMETGGTHATLEHFCELMDLPPPVSKSNYHEHQASIQSALEEEMRAAFKQAAQNYRAVYKQSDPTITPDSVLDAVVSIDGTWVRRGFSSLVGVVVCILKETAQVVDAVVLSRICPECKMWEGKEHDEEYEDWKVQHESKCQCNFKGSAPAMEAEGASVIFARSLEQFNLRYTKMVCDGDSKSFRRVSVEKPYGDIEIKKLDCVGHVGKRMGTRLRELKKSWKKRKMDDGKTIGGRGRLTDARIDKLQTYYRLAIIRNLHNVPAMQREIMAGLYHTCANEDPSVQHCYCPNGEGSWCYWQRGQSRSDSSKHSLPAVFLPVLKPIYEALSDGNLLGRCADGFTQNANESFNSILWLRCPKHRFHGPKSVRSALASAVLQFNEGATAILNVVQQMNLPVSVHALEAAGRRDRKRVAAADMKTSVEAKRKRQESRVERKTQDEAQINEEGTTYASGGF